VPLHKEGRFTAAMAVHQQQPRAWRKDEVELVRTVVNRCWETLERARANRVLTETADRLTLALAASQLGDWSWDASTDLVDLSPRAAEILGTAPETRLTWRDLRGKLHPDDTVKAKLAVERAAEMNTQYDIEYRVTRDRGVAWVCAKGRASYDSKGLVKGMFGVVQDITERKELEAELERKAAELAIADRQKDDFIALLAHELRNPLAPVRTGLELMRIPGREPGEQEKVRGMMERQLDHMVRLVDDLLDVSRITRNKLSLNPGPVVLAEALSHALEMVSPMMEARNQTVRMDVHHGNTVLWADFIRLSQVFGNLLVNASKFSGRGTVIDLRDEAGDDEIRVSITDPGIGIREEDLSRIFSMFSQAERSITSSKGGLGLGLHLARALMELQGGTVVAASDGIGKGSTFTVSIPLPPANRQSPVSHPSSTAAPSPFNGMKVLVVDDNTDALESLSLLLTMAGAEAVSAGSGEEAITQAAVYRPNLILMDVGMPGMDGLEATRQIRTLEGGRDPIVIALTGWGRSEDRKASEKAGCDGHLVKPIKFHELEALVHQYHAERT
jgi:PAS domain S-box-containing protein